MVAAQIGKGAAVRGVHPSDGTPQPDQESRAPLATRRLGIVEPRAEERPYVLVGVGYKSNNITCIDVEREHCSTMK